MMIVFYKDKEFCAEGDTIEIGYEKGAEEATIKVGSRERRIIFKYEVLIAIGRQKADVATVRFFI